MIGDLGRGGGGTSRTGGRVSDPQRLLMEPHGCCVVAFGVIHGPHPSVAVGHVVVVGGGDAQNGLDAENMSLK